MEINRKERLKAIFTSLITVLLLTALLLLLFRNNAEDLLASLEGLPFTSILLLAVMGLWYQWIDALICYILVSPSLPSFTIKQAVAVTFLGVFGNVSTLSVGTVPLQSYYLSRCGLLIGRGMGILTLEYVFHKSSVLVFATLLLFGQGAWFQNSVPELSRYILVGYLVCLLVIGALILLCTWEQAKQFLLWLIEKLPDTETWSQKKLRWTEQIEALYRESRDALCGKGRVLQVFGLNMVKLLSLCAIPLVCMKLLEVPDLGFWHTELLTSLMYLISNALPNLAGIGPTEFAFLTLYTPLLGSDTAPSVLMLYRISTYYIPFLVSILIFFRVQAKVFRGTTDQQQRTE